MLSMQVDSAVGKVTATLRNAETGRAFGVIPV